MNDLQFDDSIRQCFEGAAGHKAASFGEGPTGIFEVDRHIKTLYGGPCLINSEVQVRLSAGIAGIAACRDAPAHCDAVADFYHDAILLEMAVEGHRAVLVLDENVIMPAGVCLTAFIGNICPDLAHNAGPRRDDIIADWHTEVVSELVAMAALRITVALDEPIGFADGIR